MAPETEEEEEDPLSFIQIKSAAQWMAVSKRISWNFEESENGNEEVVKEEPFAAAVVAAKGQEISEGNFNVIDFQKKQSKNSFLILLPQPLKSDRIKKTKPLR